jgi:hypothetical protein
VGVVVSPTASRTVFLVPGKPGRRVPAGHLLFGSFQKSVNSILCPGIARTSRQFLLGDCGAIAGFRRYV